MKMHYVLFKYEDGRAHIGGDIKSCRLICNVSIASSASTPPKNSDAKPHSAAWRVGGCWIGGRSSCVSFMAAPRRFDVARHYSIE